MKLKCQHCRGMLELEAGESGMIEPFDCPACGARNHAPFQTHEPMPRLILILIYAGLLLAVGLISIWRMNVETDERASYLEHKPQVIPPPAPLALTADDRQIAAARKAGEIKYKILQNNELIKSKNRTYAMHEAEARRYGSDSIKDYVNVQVALWREAWELQIVNTGLFREYREAAIQAGSRWSEGPPPLAGENDK